MAKVCYHYNYTLDQALDLSTEDFSVLAQSIDRIQSQNMLQLMSCLDYSNAKAEPRKKFHKKIHKQAYPSMHEKKSASIEQVESFIKGLL